MAGDWVIEQRVLDLCALTDIVDDERTRSVPAARVTDDDDVRQSARQLLGHQIAGRIVHGGTAYSQLSALAFEETP